MKIRDGVGIIELAFEVEECYGLPAAYAIPEGPREGA